MKNKLLAIFIGLMLSIVTVAAALEFPWFIGGAVSLNGLSAGEGLVVTVENLGSGETITVTTDASGAYQVNLREQLPSRAEYRTKYRYDEGDTLKFSILGGGEGLTYEHYLKNEDPVIVNLKFDKPGVSLPAPVIPPVVTEFVCWDGRRVADAATCPPQRPEVVNYFVCVDGSRVFEASSCAVPVTPPKEDVFWGGLFELALIILGAFGFVAGFVALARYYWKRGKKGDKERAIKMLATAVKKAKEGKYEKQRRR